jgi:hypothetical protein
VLLRLSSKIKFSQNLKGMKVIAVAPHHRFVQPLLASYISFGVGCYCFIRTKAMREAKEMGETNIVPTPFLYNGEIINN